MLIRPEQEKDWAAVRAIDATEFETNAEADLVAALREEAKPLVSLVAEDEGTVVGHVVFSPVALSGEPDAALMALAPLAVTPSRQGAGIGSSLVRAGLEQCKALGCGAVFVVGSPDYYGRFGFTPAARFGLRCQFDVPEEAFMVIELQPDALRGKAGTVEFHAAFRGL